MGFGQIYSPLIFFKELPYVNTVKRDSDRTIFIS
jgi:hypothetical protein